MNRRILVIEDDAAMRESLAELLTQEDIACDVAETGKIGLAIAQKAKPQIVILDMLLPDISGYQLCQLLKKDPKTRRASVVMVSGRFTENQDRVQGIDLGADDYFAKPFNPIHFVARIQNLLRRSCGPNNPSAVSAA